jgi:endonuclease YncB( thermonuclease family)
MKANSISNVFGCIAIFGVGACLTACIDVLADAPADAEPDKEAVQIVEVVKPGLCLPAKCANVVDGDTIDVMVQFKVRIRLENCWCPEIHGPQKEAGIRAKVAMQKLAEGQPGYVMIPWKDSLKDMLTLDRVVGSFMANGIDVGKEQVFKKRAGKTKEEAEELFPVK